MKRYETVFFAVDTDEELPNPAIAGVQDQIIVKLKEDHSLRVLPRHAVKKNRSKILYWLKPIQFSTIIDSRRCAISVYSKHANKVELITMRCRVTNINERLRYAIHLLAVTFILSEYHSEYKIDWYHKIDIASDIIIEAEKLGIIFSEPLIIKR